MKYIALLLCFLATISSQAQTENDVVGYYKLRGGAHYLMDNKTFLIIGYATLITGNWSVDAKGIVTFVPFFESETFKLYGRHNKVNGQTTKVMLANGFSTQEAFMYVGPLNKDKTALQRMFEKDNYHVNYPNVYETKAKPEVLSFAVIPHLEDVQNNKTETYTFENTAQYNDFVVYYNPKTRNNQPFNYFFKDNKLYYSERHYGEKEDLQEALDQIGFDESVTNSSYTAPKKVLFTPKYKNVNSAIDDEDFTLNYTFDQDKNAYLDHNYESGIENTAHYDYNNTTILYLYEEVSHYTTSQKPFTINEKPIF